MACIPSVQTKFDSSAVQPIATSKSQKIAKLVGQIALAALTAVAAVLAVALLVPPSVYSVALPIVGITVAIIASFFFGRSHRVDPEQNLKPLFFGESIPGIANEGGNDCAFNSLVHALDSIPEIAKWLREPVEPKDSKLFIDFIKQYELSPAHSEVIAAFEAYANQRSDVSDMARLFKDFVKLSYPQPFDMNEEQFVRYLQQQNVSEDLIKAFQKYIRLDPYCQKQKGNLDKSFKEALIQTCLKPGSSSQLLEIRDKINPSFDRRPPSAIFEDFINCANPNHPFKGELNKRRSICSFCKEIQDAYELKKAFSSFFKGYDKAKENKEKVAYGSPVLRQALHTILPFEIQETSRQQDAAAILGPILNALPSALSPLRGCISLPFNENANMGEMIKAHFPNQQLNEKPPFLIFQINRFDAELNKRNDSLSGADEIEIIVDGQPQRYRLTSCVVHQGTMSGGHYVAIRNKGNLKYYASDDSVSPLTQKQWEKRQQAAYLLFYSPV